MQLFLLSAKSAISFVLGGVGASFFSKPAVTVEKFKLSGRAKQRLMFVLAAKIDQAFAELAENRGGRELTVDVDAMASTAMNDALDEKLGFFERKAQALKTFAHPIELGDIEQAFECRFVAA